MTNSKSSNTPALVAIFIITCIAYTNAVQGGYIWDDDYYVTNNRMLQDLSGLREIWFNPGATPQYYPFVFSVFWIENHLWGLNPLGFHIVNIFIHAVNSLFLFLLLKRLNIKWAFFSAAVFAIHPVHVESVAWITELKNVLSGFFYLCSLYLFLRFSDHAATKRQQIFFYTFSLVLYFFALLSKTVTCSLPVAILLIFWWKKKAMLLKQFFMLLPFFVTGGAMGLFTIWMEKNKVGADGAEFVFSLVERALIAGRAVIFYFHKIVWPVNLSFNYFRWNIDSGDPAQYIFPLVVALGVVFFWMKRNSLGRGPLAATLFFIATLSPALGFINVYPMRYSFVADHFQYLASIGIITLLPAFFFSGGRLVVGSRAVCSGGFIILLSFTFLSLSAGRKYLDVETLWRDTLRKNSKSFMAYNNLGLILQEQGKVAEAASHFRASIKAYSGDIGSYNNLGLLLTGGGRYDEARALFEKALELKPRSARTLNNFGIFFEKRGEVNRAIDLYKKAIAVHPLYAEALVNIANSFTKKGSYVEANNYFERALAIDKNDPDTHFNFGVALDMQQKSKEALEHFKRALVLGPGDAEACYWIASILKSGRQYKEALHYFREALKLEPGFEKAEYGLKDLMREMEEQGLRN